MGDRSSPTGDDHLPADRAEVASAIAAVLVARTAVNAAVRGVYPFLPAIARGLDTSLGVVGGLVAARNLMGLAAPVAGRASERYGRRRVMLLAVVAAGAGSAIIAGADALVVAAVGFLLVGAAKSGFDVGMQSWFAAHVPRSRRGRALGLAQLSWPLGLAVTAPVGGVVIALWSWRGLFVMMAVFSAAGIVAVTRLLGDDRPAAGLRTVTRITTAQRRGLVVVLAFNVAAELLYVTYGAWLEVDLGLAVRAIGAFTGIVIVAELVGGGLVAGFADRWGLRRTVLGGLLVSGVAYACLGTVGTSLLAATAVVVVWYVALEVTIVGSVPLITTLAVGPADRLMSRMVTVVATGRALGAQSGPLLLDRGGIAACGYVAGALAALAAAVLLSVREPEQAA